LYGFGTVYSLNMGLGRSLRFVQPTGRVGQSAQNPQPRLDRNNQLTFNGVPATDFQGPHRTFMTAVRPERRYHRQGRGGHAGRRAYQQCDFRVVK